MAKARADGIDVLAIERYLLHGHPLPSIHDLVATRLAPHAYLQLDADHPRRADLRPAFVAATARHLTTKATLLGLLTSWHRAGIDALPFKGFHLAEFVYMHPAERVYADVDILIRPERAQDALEVARGLGWRVPWERSASLYHHNHEEAVLTRGGVTVELHRYVIDSLAPRAAIPQKMTQATWERARANTWEGTKVWVPDPVDAMIMGLVLARAWSGGDRWRIKSTDYLDASMLAGRGGFDDHDVRRRAGELGAARTLGLFLENCDPWGRRLRLEATTRWQRQMRYLGMVPERGHLSIAWLTESLFRAPGTALDTVRTLPRLWKWKRRLQHDPDQGATPGPTMTKRPATQLRDLERLVRGTKWGARLLQPTGDRCRLRSLALDEALREHGIEVHLHRGYEGAGDDRRTHLWITSQDVLLRDLESEAPCRVEYLADDTTHH
jgi:hypothetical protein